MGIGLGGVKEDMDLQLAYLLPWPDRFGGAQVALDEVWGWDKTRFGGGRLGDRNLWGPLKMREVAVSILLQI